MKKIGHQNKIGFERGFSLLELMVVVVLLSLLIAIVVPAINSIAGADIKNEIVRIAGLSSEIYARAAISGITHRINFDLDNQNYWVEKKVGDAGIIAPELGYEELMKVLIKKDKTKDDSDNQFLPKFKEVEGALGEKNTLGKNLVFHGAWTEQMEEVARTGVVSIYFFSGGYTQASFVSVAQKGDEEDSAMFIELSPLTGAATINFGEPNTKELLDIDGEKEK